MSNIKILLFIAIFGILNASCIKRENPDGGVLVRIGDDYITIKEVVEMIPKGLHPNDSTALFNLILDRWIKDRLLVDFAESRLYDISNIDRRVKEYRDKLIVMEYLGRMRDSHQPQIADRQVRDYYESHKNELKTEQPLIKGVFLVINSNSPGKNEIKKLLSSDSEKNIDILEKNWLDVAVRYEYFKDKWIDWETVTNQIPFRFSNPDQFLENNRYFETEHGDCTYYLQVTDYLPSGSAQPFDFASSWITSILTQADISEYERLLVESLIKKSIEENKLQAVGYDPITHKLITQSENKTER